MMAMEDCFRFRTCCHLAKIDDTLPSLLGLILPRPVLSRSILGKALDEIDLFDKISRQAFKDSEWRTSSKPSPDK